MSHFAMSAAVELMPPVAGNELYIQYDRPGSEPAVVEREILLPLEARVSELAEVDETWAQVTDSSGTLAVRFAPDVDLKVRELELRRLASELVRTQPRGTSINVPGGARHVDGLPAKLKPQLATLAHEVPEGDRWLHEIKLDGYRLLCRIEDGTARLLTRNGHDWTDRMPRVAEALISTRGK